MLIKGLEWKNSLGGFVLDRRMTVVLMVVIIISAGLGLYFFLPTTGTNFHYELAAGSVIVPV